MGLCPPFAQTPSVLSRVPQNERQPLAPAPSLPPPAQPTRCAASVTWPCCLLPLFLCCSDSPSNSLVCPSGLRPFAHAASAELLATSILCSTSPYQGHLPSAQSQSTAIHPPLFFCSPFGGPCGQTQCPRLRTPHLAGELPATHGAPAVCAGCMAASQTLDTVCPHEQCSPLGRRLL